MYTVMNHEDRREPIVRDDRDRQRFSATQTFPDIVDTGGYVVSWRCQHRPQTS